MGSQDARLSVNYLHEERRPWHPTPITPAPPELDEKPLSYDEGWALFDTLYGSMKGLFPEEGGASGIHRKEREAWGE